MVVYRKESSNLDPITENTAAQSTEETSNEAEKSQSPPMLFLPRAVLIARPNSHTFQERHLVLDQPVKIGRSVARCRPAPSNAIFDCKVLSRNHALLWHENGKFYLQDTKSSNGTFVNNQRLSKGSEESPAREVCSGDIVQFGVDVVENSRKVTHGCIVATLRLYLPDGKEAKASPTTTVLPAGPETIVSTQELYQLSHYLQEALHREQILESKLGTMQKIIAMTQAESDYGWKVMIEEDRLLSRIEVLESQLQACGKNVTEEKLREDISKLQDEKEKYQNAAKESLKKVLQEKLEAIRKVQDLENSLSNTEAECSHLKEVNQNAEKEMQFLLQKSSDYEKEIAEISRKLQEAEDKYNDLINQAQEEKHALENKAEEMKKEEQVLSAKIEELQAKNDFAKEQLSAMKAHFELFKKGQQPDDKVEKNGILSPSQETTDTQEKELFEKRNRIQELSSEVTCLKLELKRVQEENKKNENSLTIIYPDPEECHPNGDIKDFVPQLQEEIQELKKILAETRESKKAVDAELHNIKGQLEGAQKDSQKAVDEITSMQMQLATVKEQLREKTDKVQKLEGQLNSLGTSVVEEDSSSSTNEKLKDTDKEAHSEEREKLHQKLQEAEQQLKCSQNEAEQLKKKVADYVEELERLKMDNRASSELDSIRQECNSLRSRILTMESETRKYRNENVRLDADNKNLTDTCAKLEAAKTALENRSGDYWKEQVMDARSQADKIQKELSEACEEIVLIKERYAECNKEKAHLHQEVDALNEQLKLITVQNRAVSFCSVIPLVILLIATLLAFYPSLAQFTATSDQT